MHYAPIRKWFFLKLCYCKIGNPKGKDSGSTTLLLLHDPGFEMKIF
jgi:hypothetical protein